MLTVAHVKARAVSIPDQLQEPSDPTKPIDTATAATCRQRPDASPGLGGALESQVLSSALLGLSIIYSIYVYILYTYIVHIYIYIYYTYMYAIYTYIDSLSLYIYICTHHIGAPLLRCKVF